MSEQHRDKVESTNGDFWKGREFTKVEPTITRTYNNVGKILTILAWVFYIGLFVTGIILWFEDFVFSLAAWGTALVTGTMFLGFAEIIKLLEAIKKK